MLDNFENGISFFYKLCLALPAFLTMAYLAKRSFEQIENSQASRAKVWRAIAWFFLMTSVVFGVLIWLILTNQLQAYIFATQLIGLLMCPLAFWCVSFAQSQFQQVDDKQNALEQASKELEVGNAKLAQEVAARTRHLEAEISARRIAENGMQKELIQGEIALETAASIQNAIRPGFPSCSGLDFYAHVSPASTVGGDTYHIDRDAEGRIRIVIADVMGHSIGSALMTTMLHGHLPQRPLSEAPNELLDSLNDVFSRIEGNSYLTALCVLIHPDGRVQMSSAGHPWPLATSDFGPMPEPGQAVGMFDLIHSPCPLVEFQLSSGTSLLLFTDGILEWKNPYNKDAMDLDKVREFFIETAHANARGIVEGILSRTNRLLSHCPVNDDVTLLAIKFESSNQ